MFRTILFHFSHRSALSSAAVIIVVPLILLQLIFFQGTAALAQDNKAQDNKADNNSQHANKTSGNSSDVARGKYLVEGVAMCGQCHTPRDSDGNLDRTRWLQGAPIVWLSPDHDPNWPLSAPRIGGTPPANDADMVKLLTTGIWTTGAPLRLPMPQFRMERNDAEAVVAYLKSLTRKN
jgi:mono/diheme cytochrome c family protein